MRPIRRLAALLVLGLLVVSTAGCDANDLSKGLWISPQELWNRPMSGAAWLKVRDAAYGSWGEVDLSDNNSTHDTSVLAGALVAVRTGDAKLAARVRAAL